MKAVLFDTETTGLIANGLIKLDKQPEIIEFYACLADLTTGEIEREFHSLIKPLSSHDLSVKKPGDKKSITEITNITNAMLEDKPSFAQVADNIADIISSGPNIIAHNISFDHEMVNIEFKRLGRVIAWPQLICLVEQTIHFKGYRLKMVDLYELLFNEKFEEAHRADKDVGAMLRICVELLKRGVL